VLRALHGLHATDAIQNPFDRPNTRIHCSWDSRLPIPRIYELMSRILRYISYPLNFIVIYA
jgi:hypothetical protein